MTRDYFVDDPRSNRERMLAGDLYIADDPENGRLHQRAVRMAAAYHRADVEGDPDAREILGDLLGSLGEHSHKLEAARPIMIEDNVWLGGGVIVCPGVTIGENTVIGAGSVVTKDIPANVVAVGNPARVLQTIA